MAAAALVEAIRTSIPRRKESARASRANLKRCLDESRQELHSVGQKM